MQVGSHQRQVASFKMYLTNAISWLLCDQFQCLLKTFLIHERAFSICIDMEGLRKQSLEGAQMGFTGKQVIHPNQIPVVQEAFTPSPKRVEWATELIKAFEKHQQSGKVKM